MPVQQLHSNGFVAKEKANPMQCPNCSKEHVAKFGKDRSGTQRYRCMDCRKTFLEPQIKPLGDMRVDLDKAAFAINLLMEDMSIRAAERLTDFHRDTLCNLVVQAGTQCSKFMTAKISKLPVDVIECDEQWGFIKCKQKTADLKGYGGEVGDGWVFTAMDRTSKLMLCYHLGKRSADDTYRFVHKLYLAVSGRPHISTDGFGPYTQAIPLTFRFQVDYGQVIKHFQTPAKEEQRRYSPASVVRAEYKTICGEQDTKDISTSRMERFNLSTRMHNRRMTRLTNAHSKKWENHEAMLGLYFCWYNFCRRHMTIKTTPAVAAGLATEPWTIQRMLTESVL